MIHVHTGGTYKCVYQGYPVLMVGSTDKTKVFHPFGQALVHKETSQEYQFIHKSIMTLVQKVHYFYFVHVTTLNLTFCSLYTLHFLFTLSLTFNPSILVADGAAEKRNGLKDAYFQIESRVMCSIHMLRNVDKRLKSVNESQRESLRLDILIIQLARDKSFKEDDLQYNRLPLGKFLERCDNIVNKWSKQRDFSLFFYQLQKFQTRTSDRYSGICKCLEMAKQKDKKIKKQVSKSISFTI